MSGEIWQLLENARASSMTPAEVIEQLTASLRRNVGYLARRERLHRQTPYDERSWSATWKPSPGPSCYCKRRWNSLCPPKP